ncbi:unnamed protein product, partial [Pylaiella littoralis]
SSISSSDVPVLAGGEAHRQTFFGKIPAIQGGRTRSEARSQYELRPETADALLSCAIEWEANRTSSDDAEEAAERIRWLMLEERLEEEEARLDNWMDTWCVMESGPDYPLEMAAKYHPERKGGGFGQHTERVRCMIPEESWEGEEQH